MSSRASARRASASSSSRSTHYLKEIGWTPLQVTAYFAVLNFPWVIKPVFGLVSDFIPLFGYRRKSYLIIASVCAAAGYAVIARLSRARRVRAAAAAHLLRHGDRQHAVRRAAGGERPELPAQQHVRQPAVAVVLHRHHGERVRRRRAGRAPAALSALQAAAAIAAVAPIAVVLASLFLLERRRPAQAAARCAAPFRASSRR